MPWIEGVGDEVTITFSILIGLAVILLAWCSTGIRDIPFISVIIVQFTRRRVRSENVGQSASQNEAVQRAPDGGQGESTLSAQTDAQTSEEGTGGFGSDNASSDITESEKPSPAIEPDSQEEESNERHVENVQDTELEDSLTRFDTHPEHNPNESTGGSEHSEAEIKNLSEQELRQKRLEFFRKDSQVQVPSQTVDLPDTQTINAETLTAEFHLRKKPEQSSKSIPDLQSTRSESSAGSSDPVNNVTQGPVGDQPDVSGSQPGDESSSGEMRVRIKFLNDEQRLVTCSPLDTIGNFRRRHFSNELSESKLVRFIFNGQDLRNDSSTLQSYNVMDNSVLHCLITQPQQQDQSTSDDDDGLDMGMFMFPLFGLLLSLVWYLRFMYRQFFNVTSTLTLGGITFVYLAAFLSSLRGQRHEHLD